MNEKIEAKDVINATSKALLMLAVDSPRNALEIAEAAQKLMSSACALLALDMTAEGCPELARKMPDEFAKNFRRHFMEAYEGMLAALNEDKEERTISAFDPNAELRAELLRELS